MMLGYFRKLAAGVEARLAEDHDGRVARKTLALVTARLGERLFSGEGAVAWCGVSAPFELLSAMGVTSCFVEFVGAVLANTGAAADFLEKAEQAGFSTDTCSYHRAVQGALLAGMMPEPDFLVATTCPCSAGQATIEHLARHFEKPLFVLHVPRRDDERDVAYLAGQLRALPAFVAGATGRPLDPERLSHSIRLANRARELMVEVFHLARAVPTPARRRDMINFAFIMMLLSGTEDAVRLGEAYRDEFARKVAGGVAGVPGERARLLWFQNRIQFKQPLEEMLEQKFGAAVVVDELNDVTWDPIDPDDPWPGLARRILSIPLNNTVERRVAHLLGLVDSCRVDGVVFPGHWGCRQGTGAWGLVARALGQAGVPVVNLGVDCIDPRSFSEGQLATRLEAFLEMIGSRRLT